MWTSAAKQTILSLFAIIHYLGFCYADDTKLKDINGSELRLHDSGLAILKQPQPTEPLQREKTVGVMGTELKLTVIGLDPEILDQAINAAIREIQRVEDLMTDWRPSALTRINESAGGGPQKVPEELTTIISHGIEMGNLTQGAFDITYAGAGQLWNFKEHPFTVPDQTSINKALQDVGYRRIKN